MPYCSDFKGGVCGLDGGGEGGGTSLSMRLLMLASSVCIVELLIRLLMAVSSLWIVELMVVSSLWIVELLVVSSLWIVELSMRLLISASSFSIVE